MAVLYQDHFGLAREPFSIAPDPRTLYLSERHREALAHLLYGLQGGGGFVLLTGEIGAGKTTVSRCMLEQVPPTCQVAYLLNPRQSVDELLSSICQEFQVDVAPEAGRKAHVDALNAFLLDSHSRGLTNVLLIDEAQALSVEVLEQLRLLTNLETNERKLLQIVLIGQPELRDRVAQPGLEQLAQRVVARYHLGPLLAGETVQYVRHRMAVAGCTGPLPFDLSALRRLHALTRGIPRKINLVCDRALLAAYAQGRARVDVWLITKAASEVFGSMDDGAGAAWSGVVRWPWLAMLVATGLMLAALGGVAGALVVLAWSSGPSVGGSGAATPAESSAPSVSAPRP